MEIEFKFQVPAGRLQPLDKALQRARTTRTHLLARYFDTADGLLAAHGVALRLRKEGRRWVQAAKALGDGPLHRLEHEVDLGAPRGGPPVVDPARHAGTPVGERLAALLAHTGNAPLVQTFATDIWRRARVVKHAGATVELALDVGRVLAPATDGRGGERNAPVCELELELVAGAPAGLVALAQRWAQGHGLWLSTVSKAERGERLRAGDEQARAVKAAPPDFGGADGGRVAITGAGLQRAVLATCLAQVLPNAAELASGSEDAEAIHQLRVGIRRLRSALRELDALAPGCFDTAAWEPPLVAAFRALGAQRDRELLQSRLQPRLQAVGAPDFTWPEDGGAAPPDAGAVVRAPAFQALLVTLIGWTVPAEVTPAPSREEARATRDAVAQRLDKLHRQLRRDGKRFEALGEAAQHRVRKRLKRLRYLAEFVAPLFDRARARRYLARLEPAQDALGEFNDDVVALAALRRLAEGTPRAWFAVGWLSALQPARARACRQALVRLGKARTFWQ